MGNKKEKNKGEENRIKRINLDLPEWALKDLDEEAERRGVRRQSLIKHWIIERLDKEKKERQG